MPWENSAALLFALYQVNGVIESDLDGFLHEQIDKSSSAALLYFFSCRLEV